MDQQPLDDNKRVIIEGFDTHTANACPACGENVSATKLAQAARSQGGRLTCEGCGERIFVLAGNANRIIKLVCPHCGEFVPANKLDGEGTATVMCQDCRQPIAVTTDKRGAVVGIGPPEEAPEETPKKRRLSKEDQFSLLLILGLIFVLFMFAAGQKY